MTRTSSFAAPTYALALALLVAAAGCAKIAAPIPPELIVPPAPSILAGQQIGDGFALRFGIPTLEQEDLGDNAVGAIALYRWVSEPGGSTIIPPDASLVRRWPRDEFESLKDPAGFVITDRLSARPVGSLVHYALRSVNRAGRASAPSSPVSFAWLPVALPPQTVRAEYQEDGTRVSWTPSDRGIFGELNPPAVGYEIAGGETPDALVSLLGVDAPAQSAVIPDFPALGHTRHVAVRSIARKVPLAASPWSATQTVEAADRFAPPVPSGLSLFAAVDRIHLIWDPSPALDLAGYRVYRSEGAAGEFQLLTSVLLQETRFADTSARAGANYRYAVSAVDRTGNESARSAAP
ncbi:MAG: fibronectin type III domain-containing protein [Acidobacteriota bacterium]